MLCTHSVLGYSVLKAYGQREKAYERKTVAAYFVLDLKYIHKSIKRTYLVRKFRALLLLALNHMYVYGF